MKRRIAFCLILLALGLSARADEREEATLTRVGQRAPQFSVTTIDGERLSLRDLRGKIVLLNFFATWCGPCMAELPRVEKEIWRRYRGPDFIVLAVGREHTAKELIAFNRKKGFTFRIAPDPKREIYAEYADKFIPRTYLIDRRGRIAYQSVGFSDEEFRVLKKRIRILLSR